MCSTSCAYHSGKVSLSPAVTRMPYGSTDCSRSNAKSRARVSPLREAVRWFPQSGMSASSSTGVASSQRRPASGTRSAIPSLAHSMRVASPMPTQTPHNANEMMKK